MKRLILFVVALFATFSMTVALSSCDKDNEPSAGDNTEIPEGGDSTGDEEEAEPEAPAEEEKSEEEPAESESEPEEEKAEDGAEESEEEEIIEGINLQE